MNFQVDAQLHPNCNMLTVEFDAMSIQLPKKSREKNLRGGIASTSEKVYSSNYVK